MASVQNIGINKDKIKDNNEQSLHSSKMAKEISPVPLSKSQTRESSYWFAQSGHEEVVPGGTQSESKAGGDSKEQQKDEKLRRLRNLELQEEERLRKVRELELQFNLAKKHREQQEEERRRRIEEAKIKEAERRLQVEERKRQIWEAEQERKEAILRRNMEREARIEARRNAQRNSQYFAFGSSTPRSFDLDLAAIGVRNQGSVLMCAVGKRSEERDIGPPRATSACSLDRKFGEDCMSRSMVSLSSSATFRGRKRTDITPTITPRERSITPHNSQRGKDSSRSPSRPHSSLSGTSDISATSSSVSAVQMRPRTAPRRPRPFSVAGSIVDSSTLGSVRNVPERQPRILDRNAPATATKPQRAKSANRESSELKTAKPLTAPKKPILPPKPTELVAKAKLHPVPIKDNLRKMAKPTNKSTTSEGKPSIEPKPSLEIKQNGIKKEDSPQTKQTPPTSVPNPSSTVASPKSSSDKLPTDVAIESDPESLSQSISERQPDSCETESAMKDTVQDEIVEQNIPKESNIDVPTKAIVENGVSTKKGKDDIPAWMTRSLVGDISESSKKEKDEIPASMTTSLIVENRGKDFTPPKPRITSAEEARAALAEKRRLAREQAEREAEQERLRLEEIKRKEEEQRQLEEAEQKRMEEEQIRLAELHRHLEQEKLNKAIEEQKQREKEEQERKEEEARQKAEREEQEKKAREEAEKQRIELEEKLRKEEEERAERKRRVEQIMARTRGKSAAQSPSTPQPNDNKSTPTTPSPVEAPKTNPPTQDTVANQANLKPVSNGHPVNGTPQNYVTNSWPFSSEQQSPLPDILNSTGHNGSGVVSSTGHNGSAVVSEERGSDLSVSSGFETLSSRTVSANEDMSQTNGYSSHEEMSCTTSPEESADMGLLIDIQSCQQLSSKVLSESVDFTKLVEVDPPSLDNGVNNENYLINVDDVNSNLFNSANPFKGYEDSIQQKQDASVTDLLS